MLTEYGLHPAQDVAIAGNDLRHAIRRLQDDPNVTDHVGLALAANVADALADALDRYWWSVRQQTTDTEGN